MLKIFDKKVEEYLKCTGVSEKEISRIKFVELKNAVLERLETIIKLVKENKFSQIEEYLAYSPAGDGWGNDNDYINFNDIVELDREDGTDISDIIDELNRLNELVKHNKSEEPTK